MIAGLEGSVHPDVEVWAYAEAIFQTQNPECKCQTAADGPRGLLHKLPVKTGKQESGGGEGRAAVQQPHGG